MSGHADKVRSAVMLSLQFTSMKPVIFDHVNGTTGRWTHDDYDEAHAQLDALLAENQRLREALDAADWLITNLRIFNEGGVVRGLSEANAGYESAREALRSEQ